jgi:hypothetical protein
MELDQLILKYKRACPKNCASDGYTEVITITVEHLRDMLGQAHQLGLDTVTNRVCKDCSHKGLFCNFEEPRYLWESIICSKRLNSIRFIKEEI